MLSTFFDISFSFDPVSNSIAFVALIVSIMSGLYTYLINKKKLEVTIEDTTLEIDFVTDTMANRVYPYEYSSASPKLHVLILKVVNPSPHDIGFFDLVVLERNDVSTNIIPLKKSNVVQSIDSNFFYGSTNNQIAMQLNLLESSYGIFPSNSYVRFDLPIHLGEDIDYVTLRFKVAIPSLKKVPHSIYRTKYKYYTKQVFINRTG